METVQCHLPPDNDDDKELFVKKKDGVDGQDYVSMSTPQSERRAGHKCIPADIIVLVPSKHHL